MQVNMKKIKDWLRIQLSKQPIPYSLCHQPVESLPVLQALRAWAEQQALYEELGLELTPQGVVVIPVPPVV